MHWIYLFVAIIFEVIGTTTLKASKNFSIFVPSMITVIAYFTSFYFLSLALKAIPIGVAYAIWSGFGMVVIAMIGYFIFKEKLDLPAVIGIGLIVSGVLVLNLFSKTSA